MIQVSLTVSTCKRLIAKGILRHPEIQKAISSHTLVIVGGTTNGYIAEEILKSLGYDEPFPKKRFFRGATLPPGYSMIENEKSTDDSSFIGDVILIKGKWQRNKIFFDIVHELDFGDIILKGANALDMENRCAGVFVAHPMGGTTGTIIPAVIGRRVRLIIPVGLEKRIYGNLDAIALKINTTPIQGPRLMHLPGEIFTELDAIKLLTGATAELVGGGGICGAEGAIWLIINGTTEQEELANELIKEIQNEPPFSIL